MQQNNSHLPIPSHLSKVLVPTGDNNESYVNGVICCPCGSETFSVQIVDMIGDEDKENTTIEIQATCIFCDEKHEIFHNKKHGLNRLVSGDNVSSDQYQRTPYECEECGSDIHHMRVVVQYKEKDKFIDYINSGVNSKGLKLDV